ncbi:MAG: diguanylate cyclase [Firmicutes bacterium]|nr:diguanylate cyclase [Bacillota bacterium]
MPVLRVGMDAVVVAATLVGLCEATAFTRYRLARPAWLGDWLMALLPPLMLTAMARVGGFPLPWGLWPTVTVAQSYWLDWPLYAAATVAAMAAWAVSGGPALPGALALGVVAAVAAWSPIRRRAARVGLLLASGWGIAAAAGWPGAGTRLAPGPALGEELLAGALLAGYVLSHRERTQALSAAVEAVARDHLTGALTPEGLETWLESWARPPRGLVAIVDLNDFKAVNDTYGHPVGDQLLSALARRLRQGLRNGDVVARVGGDEIACWCPGAEEEGAAQLAERLYHAVIADPVSTSAGPIRLDACLGWAVGPLGPETAARAERALLRAKRPGAPPVAGPEALQEPESLPVPGGPRWLMDAVQRLWSAWEEPAVLVDPDGRILTANGAFRRWAGKPWPQLVGQGLPELPPGAGSVPVEVGGRLAAYWLHLPGVRLPGETAQGLPGWVVTPGFTRDRRWAVAPVFQPIVALPGGEVLGYEALSRPSWEGRPVDPETLFHAAAAAGTTLEADLACFAAVERAVTLSHEKYCSASIMLGKMAEITHSFEIVEG